jgi:hypothetical protein
MSDIVVKFSYGCKNIIFELNTANNAFLIFYADFDWFWVCADFLTALSIYKDCGQASFNSNYPEFLKTGAIIRPIDQAVWV